MASITKWLANPATTAKTGCDGIKLAIAPPTMACVLKIIATFELLCGSTTAVEMIVSMRLYPSEPEESQAGHQRRACRSVGK
jgi:hypothetical protein